jgi:glycosyltransferase involved in cell wall biosynthesis
MITIGLISFNRLKYVKSLLRSLEVLEKDQIHLIVVDNGSWESGLTSFLQEKQQNGQISQLFLRKKDERNWINDEYIAKNIIIENSPNEVILFLQDDLQFIGNQEYLNTVIAHFIESNVLCMELNGVRKATNRSKFASGAHFKTTNGFKYWIPDKPHFQTMGLFRKSVFNTFGPYPVNWPKERSNWGRSEDHYDALIKSHYSGIINISCHVPLFVPIWNDTRGGYAFFRNDLRYGQYKDPVSSTGLYYEHLSLDEITKLQENVYPTSFVDVAKPIDWDYSKSDDGDQLKYSQNDIVNSEKGEEIV